MADEQVGDAKLLRQILHQVQHLGLHRDVQGAHGFISDDQARPRDQGARNGDALALATREFVWVLAQIAAAQTDRAQHFLSSLLLLLGVGTAKGCQRFGDDALHRLARVE